MIVSWCAVVYHMIMTQTYIMTSVQHQALHLGSVLVVVYLTQMRKSANPWLRAVFLVLIVCSIAGTVYVNVFYEHLEEVIGFPEFSDMVVGFILLIVVIVGSGVAFGPIFPVMTTVFVLYFFLGNYLPQPLYHNLIPVSLGISYLDIGLSGLFGNLLAIFANFALLFMVFGGLLGACGAHKFFMEIGRLVGRYLSGGPAQTAVIGSSLVGTVTGAAVANVIVTGSFTIPMMKKMGYKPEIAAAIEATASNGSQIMPPIMATAAFIMAGFLDLPFVDVMLAGLIPALLYFFAVAFNVQLLAKKYRIVPPKEKIDYKEILEFGPIFIIPLGFLITSLIMYKSPGYGAFYSILLILGVAFLRKSTRPSLAQISKGIVEGFIGGARVAVAIGAVAILAQTFITTGLAQKLSACIEMISFGSVTIVLLLTMVLCILLGCGLPASAAYALVAIMVAPSLVQYGLPKVPVHFFVFYFAIISAVTPPIALASMAASSIAKANFWKTGWESVKMSLSGFILPYLFLFNPVLLWKPVDAVFGVTTILCLILAFMLLGAAIYGYLLCDMSPAERLLFLAGVLPLFIFCTNGKYLYLIVGMIISSCLFLWQFYKWKRAHTLAASTPA